jgi:hypothetical protein
MRNVITLLVLFFALTATLHAAESKPVNLQPAAKANPGSTSSDKISQADFARKLVKVFGWEKGLPKEPKDRDYLVVLEGKRTLKFEAESVYNSKTDAVVPRDFPLYGPFSGISWIGGIATPTSVHMKVFIPLEGEYRIRAAAKGDGQIWKIAGKEFRASSGGQLTETTIATLPLKAGQLEIEMVIPPEGGVDYLLFTAPDLTPIEPLEGWRFASPLTRYDLAGVAAVLLGWEEKLPLDEKRESITVNAAELPNIPVELRKVTVNYGQPSGKQWLRATSATEIDMPFSIRKTGFYGMKLRFKGTSLKAALDGVPIQREAKSILDWVDLGSRRIFEGDHTLRVAIPAYDGVDVLVVEPRLSTPAAYMQLVGLEGDPASGVTVAESEKFLTQFVERFTTRK